EAGGFNESFAAVRKDGQWGFIDHKGEYLVRPQFDDVAGTRWVLINHPEMGRGHFSEGLAGVKLGRKWGYIDKTGTLAILPQFDGAASFFEGLAAVRAGQDLG